MNINLEEAFKYLNEEDEATNQTKIDDTTNVVDDKIEIVDSSDPIIEIPDVDPTPLRNEVEELAKELNKASRQKTSSEIGIKRKVPEKIITDLWDQVYCSLTDGSDARVYDILKPEFSRGYYPATHVAPSTAFTSKLPIGFKRKPGYNDIIVISPQLGMDDPFDEFDATYSDNNELDSVDRRNKKNRRLNFDYAKKVAEAYDLPSEELSTAFVVYVPKVSYLDPENLTSTSNALKVFPDDFIDVYLNNVNLRYKNNGKLKLTYPLNAYFKDQLQYENKDKKIAFIEANEDLRNWVDDTTDQIFYDTFGIKRTDSEFTGNAEKIFNMLHEKVLDQTPAFIDNALKGHNFVKKHPTQLEELITKEKDLVRRVKEFNSVIEPLVKECFKIKNRKKRLQVLTALENKLVKYEEKLPKLY